jgi:hypothetical protein
MNESNEHETEVLATLGEIRDRLPVPSSGPLQILSDDQAALNANIDKIAKGEVIVAAPKITKPTYPASMRQIDSNDQAAKNANIEAIAKGSAVVVEVKDKGTPI